MSIRAFFLTLAFSLTPALAQAGVDFKCTNGTNDDAVAWLRFDFSGSNGQIQIEYWNGYPPFTLVDAKIAESTTGPGGGIRIVSAPDVEEGAVATFDLPADYFHSDKFAAPAEAKYISPETKKLVTYTYKFTCVRQ